MAQFSPNKLEEFARQARAAAGLPPQKGIGELAGKASRPASAQIHGIAPSCPNADLRLKASTFLSNWPTATNVNSEKPGSPAASASRRCRR